MRSNAWMDVFSSTLSTTAWSGGWRKRHVPDLRHEGGITAHLVRSAPDAGRGPDTSRETANTCAPDVLTKVALLELGDLLIDLPPSPHLAAFS